MVAELKVIGHPGSKRFDRPSCLVSFQCSLVVLWALLRMSKLWRSACSQSLGGSIIIGASSLAGMVDLPSQSLVSVSPFHDALSVYRMFGIPESQGESAHPLES